MCDSAQINQKLLLLGIKAYAQLKQTKRKQGAGWQVAPGGASGISTVVVTTTRSNATNLPL